MIPLNYEAILPREYKINEATSESFNTLCVYNFIEIIEKLEICRCANG